ncbi:uncharacterized protein LOC124167724 [Ischnura elegans]|uniref:uncharacterized protein LOC124167724 n=1 Tax=Ischnura elegans TaxID=197161 RepID=UPI001ED86905|nr:uncharacterized protein LOC124167724 [Ischnura elegans]
MRRRRCFRFRCGTDKMAAGDVPGEGEEEETAPKARHGRPPNAETDEQSGRRSPGPSDRRRKRLVGCTDPADGSPASRRGGGRLGAGMRRPATHAGHSSLPVPLRAAEPSAAGTPPALGLRRPTRTTPGPTANFFLLAAIIFSLLALSAAQHHHGYTHKYSTRVVRTKYGALRGVVVLLPNPNSPPTSPSQSSAPAPSALSDEPASGFTAPRPGRRGFGGVGAGAGGVASKSVRSVHPVPGPTSSSNSAAYSSRATASYAGPGGTGGFGGGGGGDVLSASTGRAAQYNGRLTSTASTLATSGRHPRSASSPEPTKQGLDLSSSAASPTVGGVRLNSGPISKVTHPLNSNSSADSDVDHVRTNYGEDEVPSPVNVGEQLESVQFGGVEQVDDDGSESGIDSNDGGTSEDGFSRSGGVNKEGKWRKGKRRKRRRRRSGIIRRPRPFRPARQHHPYAVEAFLGVPYATAPIGRLRYMPPLTPTPWRGTKVADTLPPVCPQRGKPRVDNATEALLAMPRGRLRHLRRLLPLLQTSSEDCLYLNIYVPLGRHGNPPPAPPPTTTPPPQPTSGHPVNEGRGPPYAVIVYVHGESFEWNAGNPYDGSALASYGHVIVVTINFRLGILGFLKTGGRGSAQGNFGLMDLVAGLHWLRESLPAFGGDPNRVTVLGHGTGASLAHLLALSPLADDLLHRVILLSGSALSPWALQRDPLSVKRKVAEQTGCHGDLLEDDIAPCLRDKTLDELLAVSPDPPRFLPGFAPFVDGAAVLLSTETAGDVLSATAAAAAASSSSSNTHHSSSSSSSSSSHSSGSSESDGGGDGGDGDGGEESSRGPPPVRPQPRAASRKDLLFTLTSTESYPDLSAQQLEFGLDERTRDRLLRTFVRNAFLFHRSEIFSTLRNEYTDWERRGSSSAGDPAPIPASSASSATSFATATASTEARMAARDSALEVLSDGQTAAPLLKVGHLHAVATGAGGTAGVGGAAGAAVGATKGARTYFGHFEHQSSQRDYPQRTGSVRGEDIPFVLGLPLVGGQPFFPHNYTRRDRMLSRLIIHYIGNFARTGDPNVVPTVEEGAGDGEEDSGEEPDGADEEWEDYGTVDGQEGDIDDGKFIAPHWETYDAINQYYLQIGIRPEQKGHYRGHKMSLWLNLIPQLHRPGGDDVSMRHHHFPEEGAAYYDGIVRPQTMQRPVMVSQVVPHTPPSPPAPQPPSPQYPNQDAGPADAAPVLEPGTTECPQNASESAVVLGPAGSPVSDGGETLIRRLASSHYQSYTAALAVTIGVGCLLLVLNVLIFAGIYRQRSSLRRGGSGRGGVGSGQGSGGQGEGPTEEEKKAGCCREEAADTGSIEAGSLLKKKKKKIQAEAGEILSGKEAEYRQALSGGGGGAIVDVTAHFHPEDLYLKEYQLAGVGGDSGHFRVGYGPVGSVVGEKEAESASSAPAPTHFRGEVYVKGGYHHSRPPPRYVTVPPVCAAGSGGSSVCLAAEDDEEDEGDEDGACGVKGEEDSSPTESIPAPPPPPKSLPPTPLPPSPPPSPTHPSRPTSPYYHQRSGSTGGILRQQGSGASSSGASGAGSSTPGTSKKRVQIQEISV